MITRELLDRFLAKKCSAEELAFLLSYLGQDRMDELYDMLDENWNDLPDNAKENSNDKKERIWNRLLKNLDSEVASASDRRSRKFIPGWLRFQWSTAASIVFIAAAALIWSLQAPRISTNDNLGMTERTNHHTTPLTIQLTDGSSINLANGSTLTYPKKFIQDERRVSLEGSAFFDVAKDSLKPFVVETPTLTVKVLGTSFNVNSFRGQRSEVAVLSGGVEVAITTGSERLVLRPNQRIRHVEGDSKLLKELVDEPVLLKPEALAGLSESDELPVPYILDALQEAYGISIHYDANTNKACSLRVRLRDQPFFPLLEMMNTSLGLEYKVVGTTVVVQSWGCIQ